MHCYKYAQMAKKFQKTIDIHAQRKQNPTFTYCTEARRTTDKKREKGTVKSVKFLWYSFLHTLQNVKETPALY